MDSNVSALQKARYSYNPKLPAALRAAGHARRIVEPPHQADPDPLR